MMNVGTRIHELSGVIKGALEELVSLLEGASVEETVEVGYVLWFLTKRATESFQPVKERIREEAVSKAGATPGRVCMQGLSYGCSTVTIPRPQFVLKRGVKEDALRTALGEEMFNALIQRRVMYCVNQDMVEETLTSLTDDLSKDILMNSLEVMNGTPRVSFEHLPEKQDTAG